MRDFVRKITVVYNELEIIGERIELEYDWRDHC